MTKQGLRFFILISLLAFLISSCTTIPELKINYRMPDHVNALKGYECSIDFIDDRTDKDIFGPGAKDEFKGFPGNFSFSVSRGEEDGFKIGLFDLKSLFIEAFKRKLLNLGISVDSQDNGADMQILIVLKAFRLDLDGRKWTTEMGYEARLLKDGIVRSTQSITVAGERVRLLRNDQAHILMGELFSDIINKLDMERLLRQGNELNN